MLALLLCLIPYVLGSTAWVFGSMAAARTIHKRLITSILGTTLRYVLRVSFAFFSDRVLIPVPYQDG